MSECNMIPRRDASFKKKEKVDLVLIFSLLFSLNEQEYCFIFDVAVKFIQINFFLCEAQVSGAQLSDHGLIVFHQ
jgi:hypothetical protein